jgi:hypothetical protein
VVNKKVLVVKMKYKIIYPEAPDEQFGLEILNDLIGLSNQGKTSNYVYPMRYL